jgi:Peptidase family M28/PKD domain
VRPRFVALFVALALTLTAGAQSAIGAKRAERGRSGAAARGKIPSIKNLKYEPTPAIEAIPPLPDPTAVPKPDPTGNYNAYDINVYETFWFPERQPGDESAKDEPGGAISHGTCPQGGCPNHEREFQNYWKKRMKKLVKPFGGTVKSYPFFSQGAGLPEGAPLAQPEGDTANLMATIPGSKHPDQSVIVSGHYDQTDSGPASAWDSAEGHATVFRIAKLMIDYWKKTRTRPPVSVKFASWGAEESGSFGSQAYVRDNLFPFPSLRVRGYFNLDPCAGAYPAYLRGNPAERIPMVMQLSDPNEAIAPAVVKKIKKFNKKARVVLGDVMNHLDDELTDVPGAPEIFVSKEEAAEQGVANQENEIVTALGGLAFFSSDYTRFEDIGTPILNLFPDVFGPHADNSCDNCTTDGIQILHTPQDNMRTLNSMTGVDQTGLTPSEGWYKGLEFCAHMHSWFMLQPMMGGSERRTKAPVAYFEPTAPSPAPVHPGTKVTFDASGSYAFKKASTLKRWPTRRLKFRWNLGDGTKSKKRKVVHAYKKAHIYDARLTVIKPGGGKDSMRVSVKVDPN